MDEDKTLEFEKDTIKQQVEQARIIADALERHEKENKRLWVALLCCIAALMLMAGSAVYTVSNAQRIANEAMLNALNSVAEIGVTQETTTTTTQTVEGDSATINNVDGEQYNDSATNNGGGE